jgi:hypothetical protein
LPFAIKSSATSVDWVYVLSAFSLQLPVGNAPCVARRSARRDTLRDSERLESNGGGVGRYGQELGHASHCIGMILVPS